MRRHSFCLLASLLLGGGSVAAATDPGRAKADEWICTVRPGDNLWTLSRDHLLRVGYWKRVQALNHVADPFRVPPGTKLRIPFSWLRVQPAPARVLAVAGRAEVVRGGTQDAVPLAVDLTLRVGDAVTTQEESSATVEFADQSRMLVAAGTRVVFDVLSAFGRTGMVDTQVRLERGRSEAQVSPRRGRFRIANPAAVTVARGTGFRTTFVEAESTGLVEVTEGVVAAEGAGSSVEVNEGFGTVARAGEAPRAPIALLPPPDVTGLSALARRLPLRLQVGSLPGASGYRLQVATDDQFQTLTLEKESAGSEFVVPDLADGSYFLRFRAIDAQGLAGRDAVARLTVDARPEPPVLLSPAGTATVLDARPSFEWSAPAGSAGYHFQLAKAGKIEAAFVDATTTGASFVAPAALEPGAYEWRVATRDAAGGEGPFGDTQAFTRRDRPTAPVAEAPGLAKKTLTLAWSAGSAGQQYRLQLARDAAFSTILLDEKVKEPRFAVARPRAGRYYLRLSTIDADGLAGEFGPPQSLEIPRPKRRFAPYLLPAVTVLLGLLTL